MKTPKETSLWKSAFGEGSLNGVQANSILKLQSALESIEQHVAKLLENIPNDCKWLTVHDVSHAYQLWDVASTICGPRYVLNPLEGFVLGVAFLIHDCGLTASAYPGGIAEIKKSSLYVDMLARAYRAENPNSSVSGNILNEVSDDLNAQVLFDFLREVHGERALHLLEHSYIHPITKHAWTIVPQHLLCDVGEITGRIAASHSWSISTVAKEFDMPATPPAGFPDWSVDGFKLACILRCADACAIDERRAPVMRFVLENPQGVSRDHWIFQINIKPAHMQSTGGLVFQSKRPFSRDEMDAWWLAYEAITLADRELRDSDRLLRIRQGHNGHANEIDFLAKRVEGALDPDELSKNLKVTGWVPVNTSVRIPDPISIIERFGGSQLYGSDRTAPIRELIQNAADAVRVRRLRVGFGKAASAHDGEIIISIEKHDCNTWIVRVCDNGIGMPEEVLTGSFLEFGKSFWQSNRLSTIYPGLLSNSRFRPNGRFGIGFYSVFLLGEDVKVLSKPSDSGVDSRRVLHFRRGVKARAEFRRFREELDGEWPYNGNTIVEIKMKSEDWLLWFAAVSVERNIGRIPSIDDPQFWKYFQMTLAKLVLFLDVKVALNRPGAKDCSINTPGIFDRKCDEFVQDFNKTFGDSDGFAIPKELAPFVSNITSKDNQSRGSLTYSTFISGIYHIGGLTVFSSVGQGPLNAKYVTGAHEVYPVTASRQQIELSTHPKERILWAENQVNLMIDAEALEDAKLGEALLAAAAIGVDLGDKWFLYDWKNRIIFFENMKLEVGDKIFIVCAKHPFQDFAYIGTLQHAYIFSSSDHIEISQFKYVLTFNSPISNTAMTLSN